MRSILVLNPKGGCGKTTLAVNIAGYYALRGKKVVLADCDPQGSSTDWLMERSTDRPPIHGIEAFSSGFHVPRGTEYLIMDAKAATYGTPLADLVRRAQSLVIPILPSPLDMRAASRFIVELTRLRRILSRNVKLATVANRVREDTLVSYRLETYLEGLKLPNGKRLPFLTVLRASQNYIRAADQGLTIFELAPSMTYYDMEQWVPLLRWLNSPRSIPG